MAIDESRLPTGEVRDITGTPLDFRKPATVGSRIDADFDQLNFTKGYDHCWVINKKPGELGLMARITEPKSGRVMEVLSTEPGLQFYAGVSMDDDTRQKRQGVSRLLRAHAWNARPLPRLAESSQLPLHELKPGEVFQSTIIYRFSAK